MTFNIEKYKDVKHMCMCPPQCERKIPIIYDEGLSLHDRLGQVICILNELNKNLDVLKEWLENDLPGIIINIVDEEVRKQIEILRQELIEYINELIKDFEDRIAAIEERLNNFDGKFQTIEETIRGINGQIDGLKGEINGINGKIDILNGKIDILNGDIEQIRAQIAELSGMYQNLRNEINEINVNIDTILISIGSINDTIGSIQTSITDINNTIEKLQTSITNINSTIENLQTSVTNINEAITTLQVGMESLSTLVNNLQTTVGNMSNSITSLDNRVTALEGRTFAFYLRHGIIDCGACVYRDNSTDYDVSLSNFFNLNSGVVRAQLPDLPAISNLDDFFNKFHVMAWLIVEIPNAVNGESAFAYLPNSGSVYLQGCTTVNIAQSTSAQPDIEQWWATLNRTSSQVSWGGSLMCGRRGLSMSINPANDAILGKNYLPFTRFRLYFYVTYIG